jgi:hypothetical protein
VRYTLKRSLNSPLENIFMNRNSFLNACLAAASFLTAPFIAVDCLYKERVDNGIILMAGKDRPNKATLYYLRKITKNFRLRF